MNAVDGGAFATRIWMSCLATQELLTIYLGVRLGLYDVLADGAPVCAASLASRAEISPRYAREWLEQQAVAGILRVRTDDAERRYVLPREHAKVLTISDDALSLAAMTALSLGGVARALPQLLDAYRSGTGVPDSSYGEDWRIGHAGVNLATYRHKLSRWIQDLLPSVHSKLTAGGLIADVGCGAGWAGISLAESYGRIRVRGYDLDSHSVAAAEANARSVGTAERVSFEVADCTRLGAVEQADLVLLCDVLHEAPRPVELLESCRRLSGGRGTVLVLDAKVRPEFTTRTDEVERYQYATSLLHCLPVGMASRPSAATGTIMRPSMVDEFAHAAGFRAVSRLQIDDRFHLLYRLLG